MRSRRLAVSALAGLGLFAASAAALADAPVSLVRRLTRRAGGVHALADASGRVPFMVTVPPGVDPRAEGLLPLGDGLATIRLAPGDVDAFEAGHPGLGLFASPRRRPLLDVSGKWTQATSYRSTTGLDGAGVVVGVIDTGIDIRHADFRDASGKTRIAWLLQGGAPAGLHPDLEAAFGCSDPAQSGCAIYAAADIDAMLAGTLDQADVSDPEGHGTHVTSIAAGNGGAANPNEPGSTGGLCTATSDCASQNDTCTEILGETICTHPCPPTCGAGALCRDVEGYVTKMCIRRPPTYVGVAPGATLVVAAPAAPGSGFYDPDLVRAGRFVFDRADALGLPAVVNLSVGGDFGPHDGSSLLEKGLAELVGDDKPGRAIVVAAGNSGTLYAATEGDGPYGIHTEAHVSEHATTRVPVRAPASKNGQAFVWITFRPGDEVSVGLEGPGGETWIGLTAPGDEEGEERDDGTTGAVVNNVVDGKTQLTADTNGAVVAWDGAWPEGDFAVLLRGRGDAQLWIVGQGDAAESAESLGVVFHKAIRQGTINVPASHPRLLAVGCTINRIGWKPLGEAPIKLTSIGGVDAPVADSLCYFSSAGPTPFGVPKPELVAPGGFIAGALSHEADPRTASGVGGIFDGPGCPSDKPCYLVDETHAITAGSSMSAPHVAGAVALLLQRDRTLTQGRITEALQAGARYPSGLVPSEPQLGPGELDVLGAMRAIEEDVGAVEPDLSKSWYVLSSAYARPDPSWPVHGTVELRRPDGTPASGLDGSKLRLEVRGGTVLVEPERVRHGMFHFAVAGARGRGGQTMTIDVTYDGATLCSAPGQTDCGPRVLPIGGDVWVARGGLEGVGGGCSCAQPGGQGSAGAAAAAAALGALAARRRRRRTRRDPRG